MLGLIAAVIFALSGAGAWWYSSGSADYTKARNRDSVLITAKQSIAVLNSLDYRQIDDGLASWRKVSTGTLADQFNEIDAQDRALLADQKKISQGKVVEAAVLDVSADTATVLASAEVTVRDGTNPDAEPTIKRHRYSANLVREKGEWKVSTLEQVAVQLS